MSLQPITSLQQVLYNSSPPESPAAAPPYPRRSEVGLQTDARNGISHTDRLFLERNLEKLVAEQGISVIGELTQQMSSQQIEQLVRHMKEKLGSPDARGSRQPIDLASVGELSLDKFLSQLSLHQVGQGGVGQDRQDASSNPPSLPTKQSKRVRSASGSVPVGSSMPDLSDCHKSDTSSEDIKAEAHRSPRHKPRKSNLSGRQNKSKTDLTNDSSNSTKNLNVRFDPAQVPERSPHSARPEPSSSSRRHRSGRHRSSHHKRSSSRSRVIQEVSRTGSLPRSHSYSGRTGLGERIMDEDERSECSTCSSSSSDSDDPYAYQLPPRRAYGGVRLSYVPTTGWHTVGWEVGAACECNKQPTTATSLEVRLFLLWNLLPASSNQPSAETAAAWIEQLSEIKTASSLEMEQDVTSSAWEDFETVISEVDVTSTVAFLAATYI